MLEPLANGAIPTRHQARRWWRLLFVRGAGTTNAMHVPRWHQLCMVIVTQPANGARRSAKVLGRPRSSVGTNYPGATPSQPRQPRRSNNTVGRPRHSNTRGSRVIADMVSKIAFQSRTTPWEAVTPSQMDV